MRMICPSSFNKQANNLQQIKKKNIFGRNQLEAI